MTPKPLLSADERYRVASYRSSAMQSAWWAWLVVRCLAACYFAYGLYSMDQAVIFAAFGTLFIIDIYSQARQPRHTSAMRSALEKLEGRIAELEHERVAGESTGD